MQKLILAVDLKHPALACLIPPRAQGHRKQPVPAGVRSSLF